jgi:hypothetical protein
LEACSAARELPACLRGRVRILIRHAARALRCGRRFSMIGEGLLCSRDPDSKKSLGKRVKIEI